MASEDNSATRDPLELATSAFLDELRQGQHPTLEEFVQRHPRHAVELSEVLPLVAAMESFKTRCALAGPKAARPGALPFAKLGDCRIIRQIGRGGMGVVFEAVQEPIGRKVAVKLLPATNVMFTIVNKFGATVRQMPAIPAGDEFYLDTGGFGLTRNEKYGIVAVAAVRDDTTMITDMGGNAIFAKYV